MKRIGFKKIIIISLIIIILIVASIFIFKNYPSNREDQLPIIQNTKIDIMNVPLDKLAMDEMGMYYLDPKNRVTFNGNETSQLFFSPSGEKIGFIENKNIFDENIPEDEQIILHVGDANKKDFKEIFHGSIRISGWEWFSENEALVYYSCGTECQALFLENVDSGEEHALVYGVNYEWSPNKEFAVAYHYSWKYGITAGDKNGHEILTIMRDNTAYEEDALIQKTKAVWSPDSSKLALIIKKEAAHKMELLIFDVTHNFKQIYRQDIANADEYNLNWEDNSKNIKLNEKKIKLL